MYQVKPGSTVSKPKEKPYNNELLLWNVLFRGRKTVPLVSYYTSINLHMVHYFISACSKVLSKYLLCSVYLASSFQRQHVLDYWLADSICFPSPTAVGRIAHKVQRAVPSKVNQHISRNIISSQRKHSTSHALLGSLMEFCSCLLCPHSLPGGGGGVFRASQSCVVKSKKR